MTDSPTATLPRAEMECPSCGTPAERGQLVCLSCGTRLALDYSRPPGWKPAAAVVGVVVLLCAATFVLLLTRAGNEAEDEVARVEQREPALGRDAREQPAGGAGRDSTSEQRTTTQDEARPGQVGSWPEGRRAFTVVLFSGGDPQSARNFARRVASQGVEVGVLRSDDFPNLGQNLFFVFSGTYPDQALAQAAASRLGRRFPGAFPQLVDGSGR